MSTDIDVVIDEKIKVRIEEPKNYKVIFLNDDTTPMDFVVAVLRDIFHHTEKNAIDLTMQIHEEGSGIAGIYTYEIAEMKAIETVDLSRNHGFNLQVKMEKE